MERVFVLLLDVGKLFKLHVSLSATTVFLLFHCWCVKCTQLMAEAN